MKALGVALIVVAGVGLLYAFSMDTSIDSGGLLGRVNNLGLMADRQNYLIASGFAALIGVVLFLFGGRTESPDEVVATSVKCIYCAEFIKREAQVCRHCGRDQPEPPAISKAELDMTARFDEWLANQSPPVLNPTPAERAEYQKAFEYNEGQRRV